MYSGHISGRVSARRPARTCSRRWRRELLCEGTKEIHNLQPQDNEHLHGPLGLALAPNGDLITANGDAINPPDPSHNSEIVEFTPEGQFVSQFQIDSVAGSAFGLAVERRLGKILFAAVDDNISFLDEWSE